MANEKASAFPDGSPVLGTDKFPFVRTGDPQNYTATAAEIATYVGSSTTLSANSVFANPGTASAAGQSVTVGDSTGILQIGGVSMAGGTLTGTAPTTYYLTAAYDPTGIAGYYTAARVPGSTSITPSFALTGTSDTTVLNFITPPGDPGAAAEPPGSVQFLLYGSLDAGTVTLKVNVRAYHLDGTDSNLGTSSATTFTSTTAGTPAIINWRKNGATAMVPTDRLVFRVLAARVTGSPTTVNLTLNVEATSNRPTANSSITGTGVTPPGYEYNVMTFGAKGDAKSAYDGVMTSGSPNLQSSSTTFTPADVTTPYKKVHVNGALGLGSPPLIADLIAYVDAHNVTLSANATANTSGIQTLDGAAVDVGGTSGYYVPNDVVSLVGGTYSVQSSAIVISTTVRPATDTTPALTIVNPGSLGTRGNYIFQGTTGTGRKMQVRGIVDVTGALVSVALVSGGIYVVNPGTTAEPITDLISGLTGATVAIGGIDAQTLGVNAAGSYTVLPPDPVDTTAGSISGATGLTVDASWTGTGRFVYGTNDRDAIANTITAAINADAAQTRRDVIFPSRMFLVTGTALPVMTGPVRIQGGGRYQTTIFAAEGYGSTSATHVLGWSDLFPSQQQAPITSPLPLFSQGNNGAGAVGIEIDSDSTNTVPVDAYLLYDRCSGMYFDDFGAQNVGSAFRTGVPLNTTQSLLRESLIKGLYTRNCGTSTKPVIDLMSRAPGDGCNYLTFRDINVVFPRGIGWLIDNQGGKRNGVKEITAYNVRIEQPPSSVYAYNQLQLNSPDSPNALTDIYFDNLLLVGARPGVAAIALYGSTENARPRGIRFSNMRTIGPVLGTAIQINSGYDIEFDPIDNATARTAQVELGNHSDYRLRTTAASGSTSSTVVTAAGPATDNGNVGAAAVHTVTAVMMCSQSGTTLTVSSMTSGRIVVGGLISGSGVLWTKRVTAQLTGTPGGVGTYTVSNSQTMSSVSRTCTFTETRYVTGYVASTKTSTIGACQGSAATWGDTPQSGDVIFFQSLVDANIYINGFGAERLYTYSLGTGAGDVISDPILAVGDPTGTGTVNRDLSFTGDASFTNAIITGGTLDGLNLTGLTSGRAIYASGTGTLAQFAWPTNWVISGGTLVPSSTVTVGLNNSLADTIPAGTYDLGPFINGGTILNSYAHVVSGTIAFGVAIGQPGTYTDVTGLTAITSSSTTIDTIGTATAANVIAAGAHAWLKVTAGAPGGDIFITVKVP